MLPNVEVGYLLLITLAQVALSLAASYIPGFREWFAAKTDVQKSLGMLLSVTLITVLVGVLSFTKIWVLVPATQDGVLFLVLQWLFALNANQTAYKLSPQTDSVRAIKLNAEMAAIDKVMSDE